MNKEHVTKGPVHVHTEDPEKVMGTGTRGRKREEREANAQLIAEAFNILHETGYTPRELAAAVMEYRAMVKRLLRNGMMKEEHKNAGHALLTKYQPVNL